MSTAFNTNIDVLSNMFPSFSHVVERVCTPSWHIKKEVYDRHNLILIYDGEALFGCNNNEFRGSRGHLVYFKPGDSRWANTFPENLMKCFAVDFQYVCPVINDSHWEFRYVSLPFQSIEKINDHYLFCRLLDLFDDFTKSWLSGKYDKTIRCRSIFMEILNLLLMWKSENGLNYDKVRKVEKVINYMTEHYMEKITLEDLGNAVQISPSYLGSIFKDVTGKSPIEYLIHIRMNKAKELIRDGYNVSETAQRIGFSDIYYFSKCFKKLNGISPSLYLNS